jgi:hypothetical protein
MKLTHPTTSYIVAGKVYQPGEPVILPDTDPQIPGLVKLGFVGDKPAEQELDGKDTNPPPDTKPLTLAEKMAAGRAAAKAKREAAKAAAGATE